MKKIAADELCSDVRIALSFCRKPFFFLWYHGEVLMNKGMEGASKTAAVLREMWKYDSMVDIADDETMDRLYETIAKASGDEAAKQAWDVWGKAAKDSRQKKGDAAASKWYKEVYQQLDDEMWEIMYDHGCNKEFLSGLGNAYRDARKGNERVFDWLEESQYKTVFAYAFLMGMEASAAKQKKKQEVTTMTENEKLIKAINNHLPKLPTKQLRTLLVVIYEFLKINAILEGSTN